MHYVVEITDFLNLPVYTSDGTFVGNVKNAILDVSSKRLHALLLGKTNPALVEGGSDVAVPYRWVRSHDDVVILSFFPDHVGIPADETAEAEAPEDEETPVGELELETVQ